MSILDRMFKLVHKNVEKSVESSVKSPKRKRASKNKLKKIINKLGHPEILGGLDKGQQSAVLSDNSRTLVLAGAGAGKTKVLLCRILHLLQNCNVKSWNILAVTFTKNATLEMTDRLISYFEPAYENVLNKTTKPLDLKILRSELIQKHTEIRSITIRTIHSLCNYILRTDGAKIFNTNFKVVGDEEKYDENRKSELSQQKIIKLIIFDIGKKDPEFIEKVKKFIYDYLIDYDKLNENKQESTEKKYVTLDGKAVRSKSERDIANFLVQNNIRYFYEEEVNWVTKSDDSKKYKPDFYLPDYDIYIEHWWVSSPNENVPENFIGHFDKNKYLKEREWKLGQFKEHKKTLIESSEKQMRGNLIDYYDYLYNELLRHTKGAIKYTPSKEFIQNFKHMRDGLNIFIVSLMKIINLAKSNRVNEAAIKENLKNEKHDEITEFYDLLLKVYGEYEEFLVRNSLIDYNDMIHKVIDLFNKDEKILLKYQKRFKHILVDEYQDVSFSQVELLKLLLAKDNGLFAVGDDWQSIYGFRGSEVEFIIKFSQEFKKSKIIVLPFNYRSGKNIVEASNNVIMKNSNQIKKQIRAFRKDKDEKIFQYNAIDDVDSAQFIMDLTKKLYSQGYKYQEILLLYRRSKHIFPYREFFKKQDFKINTKTIHSSKGLEAKIVFLVGLTCRGFPYVWEDPRIVQTIKKTDLLKKEEEERRIFYVAMTRAKERLILLSEKNNESCYCNDIPDEFKKVKVSETEFKEEMLNSFQKDILEKVQKGKTTEEIAGEMKKDQQMIEKSIATLIRFGLLEVTKFVDNKTYAVIKSKIPKGDKMLRLTPIKDELPDRITYGEIRYVIADMQKNRN